MGDPATFTLIMILVQVLIGPIALLIIGLGIRAAFRARSGGGRGGSLPGAGAKLGCGLIFLVGVCGFCGLMVATAGGAMNPALVTRAAPWVCDGTVETRSRDYSYKPGQQGTSHNITCTEADGGSRDITLRAIGAATIYYTLIFLPFGLLLLLAVRALFRRSVGGMAARAGMGPGDADKLRSFLAGRLRTDADIIRRPAAAPSGPTPDSIEERLRHLQSLRESGLVSDAEYQAKRAEILAEL
jgi:hypothetical protein